MPLDVGTIRVRKKIAEAQFIDLQKKIKEGNQELSVLQGYYRCLTEIEKDLIEDLQSSQTGSETTRGQESTDGS